MNSSLRIDIDTPSLPVKVNADTNVFFFSIITILWWVSIWGLTETVMTLLVKNSVLYRLGIYVSILVFIIILLVNKPQLVEYL